MQCFCFVPTDQASGKKLQCVFGLAPGGREMVEHFYQGNHSQQLHDLVKAQEWNKHVVILHNYTCSILSWLWFPKTGNLRLL